MLRLLLALTFSNANRREPLPGFFSSSLESNRRHSPIDKHRLVTNGQLYALIAAIYDAIRAIKYQKKRKTSALSNAKYICQIKTRSFFWGGFLFFSYRNCGYRPIFTSALLRHMFVSCIDLNAHLVDVCPLPIDVGGNNQLNTWPV